MESLGKYLKAERESQNLSLQEVSASTKIREPLLRAIEEDRYDLISSPVYVKGFLDAYARYLGLDSNEILLQYQENYEKRIPLKGAGVKQPKPSPSLERSIAFSKRRGTLWFLIIAASVMVLLIAMVIYRISLKPRLGSPRLSEEESELTPVPPVPSPPPIQEEADTQITEPPEKVETPQQMGSKKNRGGKIPGKSGLRKKSERDRQNGEQKQVYICLIRHEKLLAKKIHQTYHLVDPEEEKSEIFSFQRLL